MSLVQATSPEPTIESLRLLIDCNGNEGGQRPHAARRNLVRLLWNLIEQGPVESKSGHATALLRPRLGPLEAATNRRDVSGGIGTNMTPLLRQLERHGVIARKLNGKRCYLIEATVTPDLMVRAGYSKRFAGITALTPVEEPLAEPAPEPIEPTFDSPPALVMIQEPALIGAPEVRVDTAGLEPVGILIEAVRLISTAIPLTMSAANAAPPVDVLDRLASTLADNERLRRKLSQLGDELHAAKAERDGLRKAKHMLETNLSDIAKGSLNEQNYRRYVELDRLVRAAPGSLKGD